MIFFVLHFHLLLGSDPRVDACFDQTLGRLVNLMDDWDRTNKVRYFDDTENLRYVVQVQGGRLLDRNGVALDHTSRPGINFVVDQRLDLLVREDEHGFHHSSLAQGEGVWGAGKLNTSGGLVTRITDESGHYHPTTEHMIAFLEYLQARGVDLSQAKLELYYSRPTGEQLERLRELGFGRDRVKWFF